MLIRIFPERDMRRMCEAALKLENGAVSVMSPKTQREILERTCELAGFSRNTTKYLCDWWAERGSKGADNLNPEQEDD